MRKQRTVFLLLQPFLAVTALVLISVWNVLVQSFGYIPAFDLTQPTLAYYKAVFTNPDFLSALGVSLKIALWSAALACILGVALSMALIRLKKNKGSAVYLVRFPILIPHAVVAVFMIQLFSQTGLLARAGYALGLVEDYTRFPQLLYTSGYGGTIAAYLWKEIPFVAYFVLAFMGSISDSLGQAAENLGASSARSFWEVTLPLSVPVIARAFLIIFIFAFGGYELPLLLGATLPKALPVQAYLAYMNPDLRQRPMAMAMNGVILLLSILMSAAYWYLVRRASRRMEGSA